MAHNFRYAMAGGLQTCNLLLIITCMVQCEVHAIQFGRRIKAGIWLCCTLIAPGRLAVEERFAHYDILFLSPLKLPSQQKNECAGMHILLGNARPPTSETACSMSLFEIHHLYHALLRRGACNREI